MSIQSRPFNLQPPPVPTENEDDRRRRKFREYLQEQAPGMELEWGTNAVRVRLVGEGCFCADARRS